MKKVMKKKTGLGIAMILAILMLGSVAEAVFSGAGSGTEQDPYIITDVNELQEINDHLDDPNVYFVSGNDIDASETSGWNAGAGFLPIGNDVNDFTGHFDGKGHTIIGLYINRPDRDYIGLFGFTETGSEIKNVGLVDVGIAGNWDVGGLVGLNYGVITDCYSTGSVNGNNVIGGLVGDNYGPITNSYATGNVTGNNDGVGGLVGDNYGPITNSYAVRNVINGDDWVGGLVGYNDGSIINSYATGNVINSDNCVGGLVGFNDEAITNCYSTGGVSGDWWVGGLVGNNYGPITNSYATGNVTGDDYVGGLVGWNEWAITDCYSTGDVIENELYRDGWGIGGLIGYNIEAITNCFSTGYIDAGEPDEVGGLVGWDDEGSICTDSFWDIETSGQTTSAGGIGKTTAEMKQRATFTNWNFINIWDIIEGLIHPSLNPRFFSGKGMWIWKLWETENGDVAKIIQKLNSANVNWVTIKLGDGDSFWTTPNLTSEKINQFHNAGIKVFGWHFVHADDDYWGVPDVSEADVSNEILGIEGIDGLIINAEGEYEGKQDNAITYLGDIHTELSIAYSTFGRIDGHEEFPFKEFGRYCDVAMPQAYWKDRPTTPTNEVTIMHNQWSDLYESWEGTEYSSSIKPIIPMGQSYSDVYGYCSGSEIIEFCNALYDYGYEEASIYRYDTMTDETRDAYTISFNEVLIAALSPVDLIVTDPDGFEISKELNEIPRAIYLEYDINGDDELDDIVVIPKRKIGDYLTQVISEPNALPTDTYSLEAALEAATEDQTMVMAEDVQIQDIPTEPYGFESKLCYSDFDGDVNVDFVDYAIFASHWSEQDCNYPAWCTGTDLDYSGSVDVNDLAIFTEHWLWPESQTTGGQGGGMGGMGGSGSQQMEQQLEEPLDTQPVQQVQPVKKININKLVRFLLEIWLQDDGIREMIDEDKWNEFIDSVKDSPAY